MNNPYAILEISESANDSQIKSAFKRLSMIHHPDRGGDEFKFKELVQAYEQIKEYRTKPTIYSTFENFTHRYRPSAKNADISITYTVTYNDVVTGVDTIIRVGLPNNRYRDARIIIPVGVRHGHRIKFPGCGDDLNPSLYSGDLYVTIMEQADTYVSRSGNDCHIRYSLPLKIAMTGGKAVVSGLLNKKFSLTIPPGTQPNSKFRIPNAGFPIMNTHKFGDLIITVEVNIPTIMDDSISIRDL